MLILPTSLRSVAVRQSVSLFVLVSGSFGWAKEEAPDHGAGDDLGHVAALTVATPGEQIAESKRLLSGSAVRRQTMELLKQDAMKATLKPKGPGASKLDPPPSDQPAEEGVLVLAPLIVTQKKPIEIPLRIKPITLDNFLYGDGKIFESAGKRLSISAGPERKGLAAIKFTVKF